MTRRKGLVIQGYDRTLSVERPFFEALQLVVLPLRRFFFNRRNSQRMPPDVTEALLETFMQEGAMDATTAEEFSNL